MSPDNFLFPLWNKQSKPMSDSYATHESPRSFGDGSAAPLPGKGPSWLPVGPAPCPFAAFRVRSIPRRWIGSAGWNQFSPLASSGLSCSCARRRELIFICYQCKCLVDFCVNYQIYSNIIEKGALFSIFETGDLPRFSGRDIKSLLNHQAQAISLGHSLTLLCWINSWLHWYRWIHVNFDKYGVESPSYNWATARCATVGSLS